jgi:hypothetical protein
MELFKNKILIALYSIWFSFHFYLFLIGGRGIPRREIYAKDYFWTFFNDKRYIFYDVSELFVYTALPILLVLLFIALFKRK